MTSLLIFAAALCFLYLAATGSRRAYLLRGDAEQIALLADALPEEDHANRALAYAQATRSYAAAGDALSHASLCWAATVTVLLLRDLVIR